MKKITSILLTLFFSFSVFYLPMDKVQAAGDGDIEINSFINDDKNNLVDAIYEGSPFYLYINLSNKSETQSTINDISISIKSSDYLWVLSDSVQNIKELNKDGCNVVFKLVYKGGSKNPSIPITVKYDSITKSSSIALKVTTPPAPSEPNPTPSTPIDTSKFAPKLTVINAVMPTANAGDTITMPVTVKNVGSYAATNITVTPELDENSPFMLENLTQSHSISNLLSNQSQTVDFKFKIDPNAAEKIYKIKLSFSYNNYSGDSFSDAEKNAAPSYLNVKVLNQNTSPNIIINNVKNDPVNIQAGQNTKLTIEIFNSGSLAANNVRLSLQGLKEDGFTVLNGTNLKTLSKMAGYSTVPIEFTIGSSEKMATGNYGLTLKMDYKDSSGKDYTQEQQFFIPVTNSNIKTTPKLILKQYNCDPGIVRAGENFKLSLTFYNTSKSKEVQNIKVYFTMTDASSESGNVFTPVNSSNTIFIDSIGPKETISQTLEFFTIPDAKARTYTMTANFEYEDSEKNEFKSSEIIGIPVNQQVRVDTSEISMPPEAFVGQPLPVSLDFYNMGKVMLRNFMVRVEGDFDSQNGKYFVGNFDIGASDHYEGTIIPKAVGNVNGTVVISFEDPAGKTIELKKDFTLNVTEMPAPPAGEGMPPEGMDPNAKGKGSKKTIWIVSIVAATGVVTGIVIRKKIKKKKGGMTLDE